MRTKALLVSLVLSNVVACAGPHGGISQAPGAPAAGSTAPSSAQPTARVSAGGSGPAADGGGTSGASESGVAGAAAGAPASTDALAASTGPGDWVAGDYPSDDDSFLGLFPSFLEIADLPGQKGNVRQYKVHVPPGYRPDVPTPIVFCIHGLHQDPISFCINGAELDKKSDAANFVLVMPLGYNNSWNAGVCCGDASNERLDDVALFRAIFKEVGAHVNIDLKRVYATGLSNGGFMSFRLACEASDIFTAVASAAGAVGTNDISGGLMDTDMVDVNQTSDFTKCEPSRPISLLTIHGTGDPIIPYSLYAPSIEHMATAYGCSKTTLPAMQPASGGDTTCVTYTGCPPGIELTGCSIDQGGHCWFGSPDCGTGAGDLGLAAVGNNSNTMNNTTQVWEFLRRMMR